MKEKTIRKMFLSVEEEFYNSLIDSSSYKEINNRRNIAEEVLINSINHEQFHLFDDANSLQNEMTAFYVEEAYIKGFTDANKLRDESWIR